MNAQPVIVDIRGRLPRNPSGRGWGRRRSSDILGVVFHQTLGTGDVYSVARYHVSPESHLAPGKGAPSIAYAFFIDTDGTIYQCNDLEDITWSQGGPAAGPNGGQPNTNYLSVVLRGDFHGPGHDGKGDPSVAQLASAAALWRWLRDSLGLAESALYGHHDFGKPACPGFKVGDLIEDLREEPAMLAPFTPRLDVPGDWQTALVLLGYDLGAFGPKGDGVDGVWGAKSQAALEAYQRSKGIARGRFDAATATRLAWDLVSKSAGSPVRQ